jgi:ribonuclease P protein component
MSRIAKTISSFKPSEVSALFSQARAGYKSAGLTILYAPAQADHGRILIITPRRTGNSPQRNRIRRQCKAIFYQEKLYTRGLDCAVIVRSGALEYSFDTLKQILVNAIQK